MVRAGNTSLETGYCTERDLVVSATVRKTIKAGDTVTSSPLARGLNHNQDLGDVIIMWRLLERERELLQDHTTHNLKLKGVSLFTIAYDSSRHKSIIWSQSS